MSKIKLKFVNNTKQPQGFTLIELVIVVVILGFLAVTAIPKFLDLTEQAKQANIEGMAGGFATGVALVRAQWEAESRPQDTSNRNSVSYDGTKVVLTTENTATGIRPGYIVGLTAGATLGSGFDESNCIEIWQSILQQPPTLTSTLTTLNNNKDINYFVSKSNSGFDSMCHYYLTETLGRDNNGDFVAPTAPLTETGNSFTYQPATSSVIVYINNQ